MMHKCDACGEEDAVDYEDDFKRDAFKCEVCGARFKVDEDADFDGERYFDCSTPGERIADLAKGC